MSDAPRPVPPPIDALLAQRAWVAALARRLVADADAAGEIEQRTWLAALERPPSHAGAPRGWLATALRNTARKLGRSESRRATHEGAAPARSAPPRDPGDLVAEAEIQQLVGRLVLDLDEPLRGTLLARYFDGLEPSEIARRDGVPPETVRTRLHRAHARLRERLDREHPGGRREWMSALLLCTGDAPRDAPFPAPVPSASAAAASAAGATAMASMKAVLLAGLVVLGAAGVWFSLDGAGPVPPAGTPAETGSAAPAVGAHEPSRARAPVTAGAGGAADAPAAPEPLPPPFDVASSDRDTDLAGFVVRADDTPVAGARVTASLHPLRTTDVPVLEWFDTETQGSFVRTAADGSFVLRLSRAEVVTLRVEGPGCATAEFRERVAGSRVRLVVGASIRVRLVVVRDDGTPAADSSFHVVATTSARAATALDVRTGPEGVATIDGVPARATVRLLANGRQAARELAEFEMPASGDAERRVVLPTGRTFRGRVTDADTAAPVAGAAVGFGFFRNPETRADADGRWVLPDCSPHDESGIAVSADGYATALVTPRADDAVDVALRRGFSVRGRVVGADGRPIAGAQVAAAGSAFTNLRQQLSTGHAVTAADGAFLVSGLAAELPHVLVVVAPGHARARRDVLRATRGQTTDMGDVVLEPPFELSGRVVEGESHGIEGAVVLVRGPDEALGSNPYGVAVNRVTDDLGRFRVPDLPAGVWRLEAVLPDGRTVEGAVRLGPEARQGEVVLRVRTQRALVVEAVDEGGAPVAGALVGATARAEWFPEVATDASGRATLAISEGRWTLRFEAPVFGRPLLPPREIEARAGETVRAVFREAAWLRLRVVGPGGRPVASAGVLALARTGGAHAARTGADGRCALAVPKDAVLDVRVEGADGEASDLAALALGVVPGSETELRAEPVVAGRSLRVRVLTPDGAPAAGVPVRLSGAGGIGGRATTNSEGVAEMTDLESRPTTVSVAAPQGRAAPRSVLAIPAGQTVEIRLRETAALRGRVLRADGTGAAGAFVTVFNGSRFLATDRAGDDGSFSVDVPADEPGPFRVVAGIAGENPDEDNPRGEAEGVTWQGGATIRLDR